MSKKYILTSESVSEGHPDKVADRISDTILDAHLEREPASRVACETLVTKDFVCVAGEIRSDAPLARAEIENLVRETVRDIGYTDPEDRFSADSLELDIRLHAQASEIAEAVDRTAGRRQGAGDQGMMFGYATDETPELMPAPITWAHRLTRRLAELRKSGEAEWLRPDAKSQVSVRYVNGEPKEVSGIVVSTQHAASASPAQIRAFIVDQVVPEVIEGDVLTAGWQDRVLVNPSGSFVHGGPAADTGLTGRKIIVDTYGGAARHGGGAFSGKDPSKVDRSGAYGARWAAKNVVGTGLASRCEVEVAYAIGVAEPVAVAVETFGTAADEAAIEEWIRDRFDLSPGGIIEDLDLLRPIYATTTAYGHFGRPPGRNGEFPWERLRTEAAGARGSA